MFYDKFRELCEQRQVSVSRAAMDIGLSNSTPTKWKKTGATPDSTTLAKVSKYFGVPIAYLLGDTDNPFDKTKTHWAEVIYEKEKAPTPEGEREEKIDKLTIEIRELTRLLKNMVDSTYNFYLSLRTLAGGNMPIPHEIAFMPEQSASIDAEIKNLIAKFLETATPEETSDFWSRYDRIGREFREQMENPAESPYPTPEEIETYGEMAKNLVMQQYFSEENPDIPVSSVKESDVG